jgi:hypothetical protein
MRAAALIAGQSHAAYSCQILAVLKRNQNSPATEADPMRRVGAPVPVAGRGGVDARYPFRGCSGADPPPRTNASLVLSPKSSRRPSSRRMIALLGRTLRAHDRVATLSMAIEFSPFVATKFPIGGHLFSPLAATNLPTNRVTDLWCVR